MIHKKENSGFLCGFYPSERKYQIGDVQYTVKSQFLDWKDENNPTLKDCFTKFLKSDLTPLMQWGKQDKIENGYVCLAAGKES